MKVLQNKWRRIGVLLYTCRTGKPLAPKISLSDIPSYSKFDRTGIMLTVLCFVLVSGVTIFGHPGVQKRYDGHKVIQMIPKTFTEIEKIMELGKDLNLDIWKFPKYLNTTMDIHVLPEELDKFHKGLQSIGTDVKIIVNDLQQLIDVEKNSSGHRDTRATHLISHHSYHTFSQISSYLDSVAAASNLAQVVTIGQSHEGRALKLLKVSSGGTGKKAIFMDGGIHAREWIASATVIYLIDQLVFNPNRDSQVATLLNTYDFYLMPMVNPDGYEYSRLHERMWRKNRADADRFSFFGSCKGVDLNRNFGYQWNPHAGGSTDPCNDIYAGHTSMSEPEVAALGRYLDSHSSSIIAYLNFHSYGEMWLYPWGYTSTLPTDWRDLDAAGRAAANAIYGVHQARFTVGEDTRVLYVAAGGADDYAKGHSGIKYSYTVELRPDDNSHYGFVLPASQIISSGEEIWSGLKAFATNIAQREGL